MDFHLDTLLKLPNVTVFTAYQKEGFFILKLELLNEGINCPFCGHYTDKLHQNHPNLVRDLAICGQGVYLEVPRRQLGGRQQSVNPLLRAGLTDCCQKKNRSAILK